MKFTPTSFIIYYDKPTKLIQRKEYTYIQLNIAEQDLNEMSKNQAY